MEKMLHVVDGKVPESLKKCFSEVFLSYRFYAIAFTTKWSITLGSLFFSDMYMLVHVRGKKICILDLKMPASSDCLKIIVL
uniref:Uncharacterized protein n=1 Tax=Strix occidentalis caurina TaxID=311401 RepID=A0A8D0FMM0_STROC